MYQPIPSLSIIAGLAALQTFAGAQSAVSTEAHVVREQARHALFDYEKSQALFGVKAEAIFRLHMLAVEDETVAVNLIAVSVAEKFIRALPTTIPLPELSIDPDGSIGLDWIESRSRILSLSVGANSRLAYAWLDGTDRGHAVARFDGREIPERIVTAIKSITTNGRPSIRVA